MPQTIAQRNILSSAARVANAYATYGKEGLKTLLTRGPQPAAPFAITLDTRADGLTYIKPKGRK